MDDAKLESMLNNIIDGLGRVERIYDEINGYLGAINAGVGEISAPIRRTISNGSEINADIAAIRTDVPSLKNDFDKIDDGFVKARLSIVQSNAILTEMIIELRELKETVVASFDRVFKLYPDSVATGRSLLDSAWNRSN